MVSLKSMNLAIEIVLALIILAGSIFWSWTYFSPKYASPKKFLSSTILNSPLAPGDNLIGQVTRDVYRSCIGVTSRFVLKLDPVTGIEEQVLHDKVPTNPSELGNGIPAKFRMPTPSTLTCGHYVYRAVVRSDCNGIIFTQDVPAAPFLICK